MSDSGSGYPPQWQPPDPSGWPAQPEPPSYTQPVYPEPPYGPPTQPTYPPGGYPPPYGSTQYASPYGPQYAQPGYPASGSGSPPPTGGGGRKGVLILAGIVALVAVVAVVLALTLSKNGSSHSTANAAASGSFASGLPTSLPSGLPTDLPTSLPSGLLSDLPTSVADLCSDSDSGLIVAAAYVGLAESGDADGAQACVYKNAVPPSTTQKLGGQTLIPSGFGTTDGTLTLKSSSGSTVTIKTTKEADGKYYVTSVSIG